MGAREVLAKGVRKAVGNGSTVHIWRDPWVPNLPKFMVCSNQRLEEGEPIFVRDLWTDKCWNTQILETRFSSVEVNEICNIPIPMFDRKDSWVWHYTKDGKFSVRSAYNLLTVEQKNGTASNSIAGSKVDWSMVWDAELPPKVKFFAWRAMKNAVAARHSLAQRAMPVDTTCPMCGNDVESVFHMLIQCGEARRIWYFSPLRLQVESFAGDTFAEWCVAVRNQYKDPHWWNLFWSILWGVWLRRNSWVFDGRRRDVSEIIHKAVGMVGDYENAKEVAVSSSGSQQFESQWKPPLEGVIKINSDAAIFGSNQVGLGAVMRDGVGDVVASTCLCIRGKYDVDVAEALAMRHALAIALESGFNRVCLETDCLNLHLHLKMKNTPATALGVIVHDILSLALQCQGCSFSFVKRGGNRVAHELSKISSSFTELRVWMEDVPMGISEFVIADLNSLID